MRTQKLELEEIVQRACRGVLAELAAANTQGRVLAGQLAAAEAAAVAAMAHAARLQTDNTALRVEVHASQPVRDLIRRQSEQLRARLARQQQVLLRTAAELPEWRATATANAALRDKCMHLTQHVEELAQRLQHSRGALLYLALALTLAAVTDGQ